MKEGGIIVEVSLIWSLKIFNVLMASMFQILGREVLSVS